MYMNLKQKDILVYMYALSTYMINLIKKYLFTFVKICQDVTPSIMSISHQFFISCASVITLITTAQNYQGSNLGNTTVSRLFYRNQAGKPGKLRKCVLMVLDLFVS